MESFKLGELVTFNYGKSLPKRDRVEGAYPVMSSAGVTGYHNNYLIKGPGIIVGRKGSIGTVYFEERDFYPIDTCFYLSVNDESKLDFKYLYYMLIKSNLKDLNSDAAVPGLNRDIAYSQVFKIPKKKAQLKIVEILDAYDNLIENNNRRIAILEDMAQSLYREWFVHFRFPGHEDCKFVDSELGQIPKGWEVKSFGEFVHFLRDSVRKGSVDENTPYMGLEHFPRKSISLSDWELVNEIGSSKLKFEKGDILFGKIRPYFHKVGVAQTDGLCSSDTFVWRPVDRTNLGFVANIAFSDDFVAHSVQSSQGTKMPRANWDVLKEYKLAIPNSELLNQYNDLANAAISKIEVLSSKNRNLKTQRNLLLPKLISGGIL